MENKIREYRKKNKITQKKLAEEAGVSRGTINGLENRTINNISYKLMIKISRALNTEVTNIFLL